MKRYYIDDYNMLSERDDGYLVFYDDIQHLREPMTKEEAYELVESLIQAVVEVDKSSDPNGLWRVDEIRNKIVAALTGKEG